MTHNQETNKNVEKHDNKITNINTKYFTKPRHRMQQKTLCLILRTNSTSAEVDKKT